MGRRSLLVHSRQRTHMGTYKEQIAERTMSLVTRGAQMKITMGHHFPSTGLHEVKMPCVGRGVENWSSYIPLLGVSISRAVLEDN